MFGVELLVICSVSSVLVSCARGGGRLKIKVVRQTRRKVSRVSPRRRRRPPHSPRNARKYLPPRRDRLSSTTDTPRSSCCQATSVEQTLRNTTRPDPQPVIDDPYADMNFISPESIIL
ncbi:hypothetical protein O0L34_g7066 [Tuta absoluta]|nr:hypothetical protein O0L34_g7066 [Tuta absoluta]